MCMPVTRDAIIVQNQFDVITCKLYCNSRRRWRKAQVFFFWGGGTHRSRYLRRCTVTWPAGLCRQRFWLTMLDNALIVAWNFKNSGKVCRWTPGGLWLRPRVTVSRPHSPPNHPGYRCGSPVKSNDIDAAVENAKPMYHNARGQAVV